VIPTRSPTRSPSFIPSQQPSLRPSYNPTFSPTTPPSLEPTYSPTQRLRAGLSNEWLVVHKTVSQKIIASMGFAMDPILLNSGIFYRSCSDCIDSHKNVYYKRVSPFPPEYSMYSKIIQTWSSVDNILNIDFNLYSSYEDLKNDKNRWAVCNYDEPLIGFPRDCGPNSLVTFQFTSNISTNSKTAIYAIYQPPKLSTSESDVVVKSASFSNDSKMIVILLSTTVILSIVIFCFVIRKMIKKPSGDSNSSPSAPPEIELVSQNHIELGFQPENSFVLEERLRQLEIENSKQLEIEHKKEQKLVRELDIAREQLDRYEKGLHTESDSMIRASAENIEHKLKEAQRFHNQYKLQRQDSQSKREKEIYELKLLIRNQDDEIKSIKATNEDQRIRLIQRQISNEGHRKTVSALTQKVQELESRDEIPPDEFLCSITQEVMTDPVVCADGNTYERAFIEDWFRRDKNTSPLTNLNLENKNLISNRSLKILIDEWKRMRK